MLTSKNKSLKTTPLLLAINIAVLLSCCGRSFGKSSPFNELLFEAYINKHNTQEIIYVLQDKNGNIYLTEKTLRAWQWLLMDKDMVKYNNEVYYSLGSFSELKYQVDNENMIIYLDVPPSLYSANILDENKLQFNVLRPNASGAYINYDFNARRIDSVGQTNVAGITELGYFNFYGVGNSSFLVQNYSDNPNVIRLNTTWVLDKPENMTTWRYGDSITGATIWSGYSRFAGIQYATNFSTQPEFVTFPLPTFEGNATLPTNLDFYVNNQLHYHEQVNQGHFVIEEIPVVTGAGEILVKTRDLLGRESIISHPYYTSANLLSKGLKNFSYEAGLIRDNFGIESNDYDQFAVVGTYSEGVSNNWTAGWHAELLKAQQTLGATSHYLLSQYMILTMGMAASQHHGKKGALFALGTQRLTPNYNFGIQTIATTPHYTQISVQEDQQLPNFLMQAFAGYTNQFGSFSFSYSEQKEFSMPNSALAIFAYSRNIYNNIFLSFNWVKSIRGPAQDQMYLSLVWSPADQYTASVNTGKQSYGMQSTVQFEKNLPVGDGYGYRLLASSNQNDFFLADYAYQNDMGTYFTKVSRIDGKNNYEFDAAGAVVIFEKDIFLTRLMTDSFAVVTVPDIKDVRVYDSNQLIGRTNRYGHVVIPRVLPYQQNDIRIAIEDLPLNASADIEKIMAYPYFHSGVAVKFPVKLMQSITFKLKTLSGKSIPEGAVLKINGLKESYWIGDDGVVYIENLLLKNEIIGKVVWNNHQECAIKHSIPTTYESVIDMGIIICKENIHAKKK